MPATAGAKMATVPMSAPARPMARPARPAGARSAIIVNTAGTRTPPAAPWMSRTTSRLVTLPAKAYSSMDAEAAMSPISSSLRRPERSSMMPPTTLKIRFVTEYAATAIPMANASPPRYRA